MNRAFFLLLLPLALVLSGCAGASVKGNGLSESHKLPRPTAIYYTPIDTSTGTWAVSGKDRDDLAADVVRWYGEMFPEDMAEIAPVKPYSGTETNGWLIKISVKNLDPGSGAARFLLGYGAGQSKIETTVEIADLGQSGTPIQLTTYGDSGQYQADQGLWAIGSGTKRDLSRTLRELRNRILAATN